MSHHAPIHYSRELLQALYCVDDIPPSGPMYDGYPFVATAGTGVGGLPRAKPAFSQPAHHNIRHPPQGCPRFCNDCDIEHKEPGPHIPLHWYNNGLGYVTNYFTDVQPFDLERGQLGTYRCQMRLPNGQQCPHEVQDEWLSCSPCGVAGNAPELMRMHLMSHIPAEVVQFEQSRVKRSRFATRMCSDGDCGALLCTSCLLTRNALAARGYEETCSCGACFAATLPILTTDCTCCCTHCFPWMSCGVHRAVVESCSSLRDLNEIVGTEEGGDCLIMMMFPCCAVGRSYRELVHAGVDPGNPCCGDRPKYYGNTAIDVSQRQPQLPSLRASEPQVRPQAHYQLPPPLQAPYLGYDTPQQQPVYGQVMSAPWQAPPIGYQQAPPQQQQQHQTQYPSQQQTPQYQQAPPQQQTHYPPQQQFQQQLPHQVPPQQQQWATAPPIVTMDEQGHNATTTCGAA